MLRVLLETKPVDPTAWIAIGFGALLVVYLVVVRPARKRKDPMEDAVPRFPLAQQRSVEREMSNLLVELSEMTRQITSQLDTRAAKLELLIKEADEKIAMLEAAQTRSTSSPAGTPRTAQPQPVDPRHAQVYEMADHGHSPHDIARQLSRPAGEIELILALRPRS